MGRLRVLNYTENCSTNQDGETIYQAVHALLRRKSPVIISFDGVSGVTSSFVNSALIELLSDFNFPEIKKYISFVDTNRQIDGLIFKRFSYELKMLHTKKEAAIQYSNQENSSAQYAQM